MPLSAEVQGKNMAERVGFEPTVPLLGGTRDFQSRSFGQLGHLSANPLTFITAKDTENAEDYLALKQ
jgi:hypothetical protein